DLISVPVSARPASSVSSMAYWWWARRLTATVLSGMEPSLGWKGKSRPYRPALSSLPREGVLAHRLGGGVTGTTHCTPPPFVGPDASSHPVGAQCQLGRGPQPGEDGGRRRQLGDRTVEDRVLAGRRSIRHRDRHVGLHAV